MNLSSLRIPAALLAATVVTSAATNGFFVPSYRGGSGTTAAGWDRFSVGTNSPAGNAPDMAGSTTGPALRQFSPAGQVLGSGNIYVPAPSDFRLSFSSAEPLGQVVFQVRTLGTELDYSSIRLSYMLNGQETLLGANRSELDRAPAVGFPGANVSSAYTWDVSALDVSGFTITFRSNEPHVSLDSVTLDTISRTALIPEPGTYALGITGVAALLVASRRRTK
jgi:hypothetical protein